MKRNYAVLFLALVVGVLTGFVVNTHQEPTRWEYARVTEAPLTQTTILIVWSDAESAVAATGSSWVELGNRMGCASADSEIRVFSCIGQRGWEYVTSFHKEDFFVNMFQRPVQ